MHRDPLAGVQTALEECKLHFGWHVAGGPSAPLAEVKRLLTEVEVGLTLLAEVRNQRRAA